MVTAFLLYLRRESVHSHLVVEKDRAVAAAEKARYNAPSLPPKAFYLHSRRMASGQYLAKRDIWLKLAVRTL